MWTTLRRTAALSRRQHHRSFHRAALVSAQDKKRALDEAQIQGVAKAAAAAPLAPTTSSSSSSGVVVALGVAGVAGGAAYAYYTYYMTPAETAVMTTPTEQSTTPVEKKEPTAVVAAAVVKEDEEAEAPPAGNRVVEIGMPAAMRNNNPSAAAVGSEHPADGHRVLMTTPTPPPVEDTTDTEAALTELKSQITDAAAEALLLTHPSLWTATSSTAARGSPLDELTPAQLQARVVQLAAELQDRTKWEALRLKEFLAMKEQETGSKYTELMQKQRMEFEDILAQRLRNQEHVIQSQLEAALREKDATIHALVAAALEAQKADFEEAKETYEKVTKAEIQQGMEEKYSQQMEQLKQSTTVDLAAKVTTMSILADKVHALEAALQQTQTHQEGSIQAHKLSAVALSLSEKLSTEEPAGPEIAALQAVAGKDGVVATAVATIPPAAHTEGIPTLAHLQVRFDDIYEKIRTAALVPAGRPGLEGQIAGRLLSSLKFSPRADDEPADPKNSEYLLAKARRHVQKGELAKALGVLEGLSGQAALTAADWSTAALHRIMVDQAIKVIKMECALLNESLVK